jgi:Flp pilus assembly protein TadG
LKAFRRGEIGGAMLEFAVAVPILVLLGIGVADFGRAFFTGIRVASAVRSAAQYGGRQGVSSAANSTEIIQAARDDADDQTLSVTPSYFCKCADGTTPDCTTGSCPGYGDGTVEVFVKVVATKTVNFVFRYPGIPSSLTYRDSAVIRAQ